MNGKQFDKIVNKCGSFIAVHLVCAFLSIILCAWISSVTFPITIEFKDLLSIGAKFFIIDTILELLVVLMFAIHSEVNK